MSRQEKKRPRKALQLINCSKLAHAFPNKEALHEKDRRAEQIVHDLADEVSSGGAGDLVFFPQMDTAGSNVARIGIMLDQTSFLGAQSSTGVAMVSLNNAYWKKRRRTFYRLRLTPSVPVNKRSPASPSKHLSGARNR